MSFVLPVFILKPVVLAILFIFILDRFSACAFVSAYEQSDVVEKVQATQHSDSDFLMLVRFFSVTGFFSHEQERLRHAA